MIDSCVGVLNSVILTNTPGSPAPFPLSYIGLAFASTLLIFQVEICGLAFRQDNRRMFGAHAR